MLPARHQQMPGALRGIRAATFALAALLLAAAAHVAGGAGLPSFPALALLTVPLGWGAVVLTRRTRGRTTILIALAITQLALHEAFMALSGPKCTIPAGPGPAGMAGMAGTHGAALSCPVTGPPSGMATMAAMAAHPLGMPKVMLAAHLAATVATALLLAHGERLLVALPELLLARLTCWTVAVIVPAMPRPALVPGTAWTRTPDEVVGGTVRRRGPPIDRDLPALA